MNKGTLAVIAYNSNNIGENLSFYLLDDMLYCKELSEKGIVALICDRKIGYSLENGECLIYNFEDEHQSWFYKFNSQLLPYLQEKEIVICYDMDNLENYDYDKNTLEHGQTRTKK